MLDAAERVFERKGYYGATVEEIAQEAEYAVGTIYNLFDGKENLYTDLVTKIAEDFMAAFEEAVLSKTDPEEAIAALIELRLASFEEHRGFAKVFLEASPSSHIDLTKALPENCTNLHDHYVKAVSGIFRRGVEQKRFDRLDPLYLALCLEGIINAFVAYWSRNEPTEPLATRVAKLTEAFLGRLKIHLIGQGGSAS